MKCFVLEEGQTLATHEPVKKTVSKEIEKQIADLCSKWQVRNLEQTGNSNYDDDGIDSSTKYEPLDPESFLVANGKILGYFANHFGVSLYVRFEPVDNKIRLGDYDFSDYKHGTGRVDRGHVAIVPRPDRDTNPYHDEPRFHSQEEYDDYIKWRD